VVILKSVIKHDMEEIWAVWRVRRKATAGVLIEPGASAPEEEEVVDPVEAAARFPAVVVSSSKKPPSVAGMIERSEIAKLSKRICIRGLLVVMR
jgi:hypothetical protein